MSLKNQWAMLAVVVGRSFFQGPGLKQSFGVLLVLSATFFARGVAEAQVELDFDTTGPTSTAQLPDFFDVFGFDAGFGADPFWEVAANTTTVIRDSGAIVSNVGGDAGAFLLGKTLSRGSQEIAQWLLERQAQSFDAVFVPAGAELAIHVDRELLIDLDPQGRRLSYDNATPKPHSHRLD